MVSAEYRTELIVSILAYFTILMIATFWAKRRMEKFVNTNITAGPQSSSFNTNATAGPQSSSSSFTVQTKLEAHYLGGRTFGPIMTAGTLFASLFSGYTVIGIPDEAFRSGWLALRWMPTEAYLCAALVGTGIRLRKVAEVRRHQTPSDFITDRFQCQILRYVVVALQILPTVIYLAAQVVSLQSSFNEMFGLPSDMIYPVLIIMILILLFESVGGLTSVAITDSIQGLVMLFSFILIPIIIKINFGGWTSLDPTTYPRPEFYQTPTASQQLDMWQFALINMSFFTLPQFIQRNYSAENLKALKTGWFVVTIAPWTIFLVGIFMGTVGVQMLGNEEVTNSPFSSIIEKIMELGGFCEFVGVIAFTAGLAAVMSTADSLIIASSQLITTEIVFPIIEKYHYNDTLSSNTITWCSRIVSLITTIIALLIGLFWDAGITAMGALQFPLSMQCVPIFYLGLYGGGGQGILFADPHPWCIAIGAILSTLYVFLFYFCYLDNHRIDSPKGINAGVTGACLQVCIIYFCEILHRCYYLFPRMQQQQEQHRDHQNESNGGSKNTVSTNNTAATTTRLIYPNRPEWDKPDLQSRFGVTTLTPKLLDSMMVGLEEPFKNLWYALFLFCIITLTIPIAPPSQPPMTTIDGVLSFVTPPFTVRGIPWWAMKLIIICIIPYVMIVTTIWRVPKEFPNISTSLDENEKMIHVNDIGSSDNINMMTMTSKKDDVVVVVETECLVE